MMMRTFLLVFLELVFLSSCSNILEDSGTPSAIAETGKLSLALEADASVNVTTKTTSTVTISDQVKNNLVITGTKGGSPITLGKSSDFANGATKPVPAGTYTKIAATYDGMNGKDLAFDSPMLAGETTESVTVTPNAAAAEASITATLTNSVITIDPATFTELQKLATITDLYVYTGSEKPTDESQKYSLLSSANTLEAGKTLFVKPDLSNVFIHIAGKLIADESKTFDTSSQIRESETNSTTAAAKNYSVQYSLANTQGSLTLTINVNGTVEVVEIPVEVNPYE